MALAIQLEPLEDLPRTPASDVKKLGWRGVMRTVDREGRVVVTNHNRPEAVILSIEDYSGIQRALEAAGERDEAALDTLRQRFDQRLASLQATDAGGRLRAVLRGPAKLRGKVRAGQSH
jgi:prevent-host-death family protein